MTKHKCCDWCESNGVHRDFRAGAVDVKDFDEVDYTPRRKKNNKKCKKSKGRNEPHDFSKVVIRNQWFNKSREEWTINKVTVCSRCGKSDWSTYGYYYSKTPVN